MDNKRINVGSLEFDQIKQNLKEFLKGQSTFSDYNFEGSNLSIILDILAYNTYYNNLYTNFGINEAFLDTATKRSSVVSHARNLGYTPRSATCSTTKISFTVSGVNNSPLFITLPHGTTFRGSNGEEMFTFITQEAITTQKTENDTYIFSDVIIKEGYEIRSRFEYNELNSIILNNENIDLSTLQVRVQNTPSQDFETYINSQEYRTIDGNSDVFFINEIDGAYELYFGDGILGKQLNVGQIVNVSYMVCNTDSPNGITQLSYNGNSLLGGTTGKITLVSPTFGGRTKESVDEIRYNAPNMYQTQNRVVTSYDYEVMLLNKVSFIKDVNVWGGENNYPPVYGKVFISANTISGNKLSIHEQEEIKNNILNQYKLVTIIPEFVDPETIDVELDLVVYYDPNKTTNTSEDIQTGITSLILDYDIYELRKFNKIFRTSQLQRIIENFDVSIISSVLRIKIYRNIAPVYFSPHNYNINIGNPITPNTIDSPGFYVVGDSQLWYIDDDGTGNIRKITYRNNIKIVGETIGSVDYSVGVVKINSLSLTNIRGSKFYIGYIPESPDVVGFFNQIVGIDSQRLKVSTVVNETSRGDIKYNFTSSRL